MNNRINIGWAQTDITPDRPIYVIGQLYSRISSYVHDPLTATCLVLENGRDQMTIVSLDAPAPMNPRRRNILERLNIPGLDREKVVFCAIHTHNSSNFTVETTKEVYFRSVLGDLCPVMEEPENILKDAELEAFLEDRIVRLIEDAWENRAPGGVSSAHEYAAVAFNRRPQFMVDGKMESRMYGTCSEENFMGYEGSSDHSADMIYTWDTCGNLTGVVTAIPCPSQVYELHDFISADYWGEARNAIRESLGNVYILPLCQAAGDQNPLDLVRISKENRKELKTWNAQETYVWRNIDMHRECQQIGARIRDAVVRGYEVAKNEIETRPVFASSVTVTELPLRTVEKVDVDAARERIDAVKAKFKPGEHMSEAEMIHCFEDIGYLNRWELQQKKTTVTVPIFALRLSRLALATCPFELYVDYSYRIKARAKATQVVEVQLSTGIDGAGYLPTQIAVDGGSYGAKPVSTSCGPEGGNKLVEETIKVLDAFF